ERPADLLTFTSSSTVKHFKALLPPAVFEQVRRTPAACIGPITADTARELGFDVRVTAERYTIPGLCAAIREHYAGGVHRPS
ncbi:MAG: uroporphyrinogen-III synthase, partial [Desulfobacterales bacterium]|nr:uroporphyrinogen-III synthase [Desulfobacterales bacterium]